MSKGNVRFLQAICFLVPGVAMAAAHWFPWRRLLGRDLHQLEAYCIGTATIVGISSAAITQSEGDGYDDALMLLSAAASAGGVVVAAYALDEIIGLRADLAAQRAHGEALNGLRQDE